MRRYTCGEEGKKRDACGIKLVMSNASRLLRYNFTRTGEKWEPQLRRRRRRRSSSSGWWNLARWTSDRIPVYTFEATRLCQLETSTLRRFSKRTVKQPGENNEIDRDAREAKNVGNPMLRSGYIISRNSKILGSRITFWDDIRPDIFEFSRVLEIFSSNRRESMDISLYLILFLVSRVRRKRRRRRRRRI